jgi:hypothetical protein
LITPRLAKNARMSVDTGNALKGMQPGRVVRL